MHDRLHGTKMGDVNTKWYQTCTPLCFMTCSISSDAVPIPTRVRYDSKKNPVQSRRMPFQQRYACDVQAYLLYAQKLSST